MANTIKIKAGSGTPTTSDIVDKELAFDRSADKLYINDSGTIVDLTGSGGGTGDIEGVTAGTGLSGGGTSGTVSLAVDLSELTDMTASVNSSEDELIILDNGADRRKLISEIPLSAFNNDSGFITATLTTEAVQDIVGAMFTSNTETRGSLTYDDSDGTIDLVVDDMTANDNTFRTVTAGGNTLGASETLAFTAGSNITISESGGAVTIASTDTNTQLSTEQVQDIVGAMFDSNTETRISATYQDGDGTIDLVVDDMTANDNTVTTNIAGTGVSVSSGTGNSTISIGQSVGTSDTVAFGRVNLGSTNDSSYLSGNSLLTADGYIMVQGIVNESETGGAPAAITFGDGATLGNDQISLVTNGNTRIHLDSSGVMTFNGTVAGTAIKDQDDMSSNSATHLATQQSIKAYVDAEVAGIVNSAPSALNTLDELAAALGDDANFATTTSTSLGNRLRVDTASQGLTGTQQANAITNLGITATKAELNYVDGVTSNIQTQLDAKIEATLTTEQVQDIVGAMFDSNTETRISATYQDGDGTIDLVVDDMTADNNTNQLTTFTLTADSGSNQTIAHGNTLDIAGGTGISTSVGSTDTATVNIDVGTFGATGNQSIDSTTNTEAEYSNLPVGYAAMMHANLGIDEGMPKDSQYFYFNKIANRDTGGGWGGIALGYNNNEQFYVGNTTVNSAFATWSRVVVENSSGQATITGELEAASLDISGDADIDGTLETDALTINGTASVAFTSADHSKLDGIASGATANTGDITSVTAGTNCSGGGSSGDVTINVDDAFLKNDADDTTSGTVTGAGFNASNYFQIDKSGTTGSFLKIVNSGWSNATTHDIIYNSYLSNLGDFTYLKSAGNSTSGHGIAMVADNVFAVGDTTVETGNPNNNDAADPFTDTWFTVDGSGNGVFKGSVTATSLDISGDIDIDGTTNLDALDVDGASSLTGRVTITDGGADGLLINNDTGNSDDSARIFFEGTSTTALMQQGNDFSIRSGATTGSSSGTERFFVNSSGASVVGDLNVSGNSFLQYGLVVNEGSNDADFRVEGNGNANLLRTDAGNDRVGIGTGSPGNLFTVESTSANQASIQYDSSTRLRISVASSGATTFTTDNSAACNFTGDVVAFASSDKKLKDNLKPIENSLEKLSKLSGYEFDWNDKQETYQGHDVGVIAQEVEKVLPEVVETRDNGYKAVKYEKIVPLLIESIKELKAEIEELKK